VTEGGSAPSKNREPGELRGSTEEQDTAATEALLDLAKRKAAEWAARLRKALRLRDDQVSFLSYHGRNDEVHFDKLENAIQSAFFDRRAVERIVKTAIVTARLYVLQLEELDHF
jgi:hypothetical protein